MHKYDQINPKVKNSSAAKDKYNTPSKPKGMREAAQDEKFWLRTREGEYINSAPYVGKQAAKTAGLDLIKSQPEYAGDLIITAVGPEGQDVDEAAYGPDEKQADLIKIKTPELRQLQALHKRYEDNPRNKESAKQGAEELKNRGITVAESNDTLSRIQQLSGIKK